MDDWCACFNPEAREMYRYDPLANIRRAREELA
jgi:hypothetical protein